MTDYNFTLMCDFYELTMANGYFQSDIKDQICYFDVFFRTIPDGGGFAIAAGLEQVLEYIKNIHFTEVVDCKSDTGNDLIECSLCCVTEAMIYFFSGYKYVVLAQYWIVDKRG